jgi:cellulose synthase/poly-beta-1,6-N-acetylglucosamine synthase-like glycosyltransferase
VSCGIRGNGWCVTHALLRQVPYEAYSLTEDLEYGIQLGLAGFRVYYAEEAHSDAEMVSGGDAAGRQRQRWEGGRFQLIRSQTLPLLRAALLHRSAVCLDQALDLLVLPLSYVALNVVALFAVAAVAFFFASAAGAWLWLAGACIAVLLLYVLRGWQLSGLGRQGLMDLAGAPFFLAWKIALLGGPRGSSEWIRTEREKR